MKIFGSFFCALLLLASLLPVTPVAAEIDTFEDGTTQNWLVGLLGAPHPAPPKNIPSGGPSGVDDNYLLLTAVGGKGPGNRLTVINASQWAGDYLAAGITGIWMDVINLGNSDLALRLLLEDPLGGPPTNVAFSSDPIAVPAGSGWKPVKFSLNPADLTAGAGSVLAALTHATELRIFHNTNPAFPGDPVAASLGVDNITAVPLPGTLLLLATGLAGLAGLARRRGWAKE